MTRPDTPLDEKRAAALRDEHEVRAEFAAHLAHRVDDLVAEGLSPEAARARALEEFGDAHRLLEETRSERARARPPTLRAGWWEALRQDLLHALRQMRRSPGFALTAVATLTLGVGASTTIVSVVDAVVLDPLPFFEPDRVVFAEKVTPEGDRFSVAEPGYLDWDERLGTMSALAAIDVRGATLRSPGEPRTIRLAYTSHQLLEVLGLRPALGRMIREEEDRSGAAAPVAMLAYDTWRTDHAADSAVVGTRLDIDGRLFEVVGVMPPELASLSGDDVPVYVPLGANAAANRGDHSLAVIGRLADGVSFEAATDDLVAVQGDLAAMYATEQGWSAKLRTSRDVLIGDQTE